MAVGIKNSHKLCREKVVNGEVYCYTCVSKYWQNLFTELNI